MTRMSHPRFVSYSEYADNALYTRFHIIPTGPIDDHVSWWDAEQEICEWLATVAKGRFSFRNPLTVICFEDRRDAMLFKMVYG